MAVHTIGEDVKSYCGKCKLTLYHTITIMDGEKVQKVQCNTCKAVHGFRDAPNKKKATRTRKKAPAIPLTEAWAQAMKDSKEEAKKYSIREVFEIGSIIDHPTFGGGIVQAVVDNDKVEVMFENDIKVLVHSK
jgi:hypothetical protein